MPSNIRIGCRVSGLVGPKVAKADGQQRRTSRQRFHGTVLRSQPDQKWTVLWDEITRVADHPSGSLKFESNPTSHSTGLEGLNLEVLYNDFYLGNQKGIDNFMRNRSLRAVPIPVPPPPAAAAAPQMPPILPITAPAGPPPLVEANPPLMTVLTNTILPVPTPIPINVMPPPAPDPPIEQGPEEDPDNEVEEEVYDPTPSWELF